jgi:hypothetical protein
VTIPPPGAIDWQTTVPMSPPRQFRVGPILFTLGIALISLSFLVNSYAYYEILHSSSGSTFQGIELAFGLGEVFTAVGVLLASVGWLLDKQASARVQGIAQTDRTARRFAGLVMVLLGAAAIAGATLYLGALDLAAYYQVTITLPNWAISFIYAVEGAGVLGIAAGWAIHRSSLIVG